MKITVDYFGQLRQIAGVESESAMAHYHLGALFMHRQQFDRARESLGEALKRRSWYPNAHYLLGYMFEEEGRFDP